MNSNAASILNAESKDASIDVEQHSSEIVPPTTSLDPPDRGKDAWLTVLGSILVAFGSFGMVNGFGAFVDFYKKDYLSEYSPTVITLIGSIQVFVLYSLAGFAGAMFDAWGPTYIIPCSGVIVVFSLLMLSITKPQQIWQQFLTQSILFNVGASFAFFPSVAIVTHWFRRKAPYAIGFVLAGASLGGVVFPIMLRELIPRIGFGWTIRCLALINAVCFGIAKFTIKRRRPVRRLPKLSQLLDFKAFREPCYLLMSLGAWFCIFSVFSPFFYVGLYGTVVFGSSNLTPYFLAITCATSIPGRVIPGLVAVYLGRFNILAISTLLSSILILAMWYNATSQEVTLAFAALYGFTSGPFFTLLPACVADISPIERIGARNGQILGFISLGALAGTPIGGAFIRTQTVENFRRLILFSGVMGLVGSCFLFASRYARKRQIFAIA